MTMTRPSYSDPGCALPEEISNNKKAVFSRPPPAEQVVDDDDGDDSGDGDADEETVVMGNLDRRPAQIGKVEKLTQICSIPEEEREARDRQLIAMYTRKKTKAKSDGTISYKPPTNLAHSPIPRSGQTPVAPEQQYPYYDLVVAEPSKVFDADFSGSAAATAPVRTETPVLLWERNRPRNPRPPLRSSKKHEVIVPPFSPKFR